MINIRSGREKQLPTVEDSLETELKI